MKHIALLFMLILSTCVQAPAYAHPDPKPIRWYAVFIWHDRTGMDFIDRASVLRSYMPQWETTKKRCLERTQGAVLRAKDKYGAEPAFSPALNVHCIAARNKLELRNFLRTMNFNFGGRPA